MNKKTQTPQNKVTNFVVVQDGKVIYDSTPTAVDLARERLVEQVAGLFGNIKLEARMAAFDALHKTNYRRIRHELMEQKKREAFEASIGLVPIK